MYRIYVTLIEILAAAIFIIPMFLIYKKIFFHDIKCTILYTLFGFYLTAILALVGFPSILDWHVEITINFLPVLGIFGDIINAGLNILLFIPFGIFVPILWTQFRNLRCLIVNAFCVSLIIEISQIFTFRTTDINDLITNVLGAMIGFFIAKVVTGNFTKIALRFTKSKELYLIYGTICMIMLLFQPFISALIWEMIL